MAVAKGIVSCVRSPRVGHIVLAILFALLLLADFRAFAQFYRTVDQRAAIPVYGRVTSWIDLARCFKETGVLFATCREHGNLRPIEDDTIADDRGHGLLLSVLHRGFGVPASKLALVFINAGFTLLAFALLSCQLARIGQIVAAALFFGMAVTLISTGQFHADAFGAFYGLFALSLVLPI